MISIPVHVSHIDTHRELFVSKYMSYSISDMRRVAWLPILRLKKCIRKCNVGCMMICLIMIVLWDHLTINNNNVQRHVVVVECDDKHRKPMLESENIIENIIGDRGTLINKEVVQLQKSYNRIQLTELAEFEGHGSSAYETNKQGKICTDY